MILLRGCMITGDGLRSERLLSHVRLIQPHVPASSLNRILQKGPIKTTFPVKRLQEFLVNLGVI